MTTKEHKKSKRRRLLKTGCLSLVVLFLILVLAATAWVFYITSGEPEVVHDEDLVYYPEPVPKEENAYFVLQPIIQNIESNNISLSVFSLCDGPSEEGIAAVDEFTAKHPELLKAFYATAEYDHFQIPLETGIPFHEQVMDAALPLPVFTLNGYLLHYVEFLIQADRQEEALECIQVHAHLFQLMQKDAYSLVIGMFGKAVQLSGVNCLQQHLSQGTFMREHHQPIREVISFYESNGVWAQMFRSEYSCMKSSIQSMLEEFTLESQSKLPLLQRAQCVLFPVLFNESKTLNRLAGLHRQIIASFSDPGVPFPDVSMEMTFQKMSRQFISGNLFGELLIYIGMPSLGNLHGVKWRQNTQAELIKLYLVLWDYYEVEGELPDNLTRLVPKYLPELPRDPFGAGGSFLYEPKSKKISSAGVNQSEARLKNLTISLGFVD